MASNLEYNMEQIKHPLLNYVDLGRRRRAVVSNVNLPIEPPPNLQGQTGGYRQSGFRKLRCRSWNSIRRWEKENELLFAMIEDESEWIATLFPNEVIAPEYFFFALEDGVLLCKLAQLIQEHAERYCSERGIECPKFHVKYHRRTRTRGQLGQFLARENVHMFLNWCRVHRIPEVILFESNDIVQTEDLREGAREVVICLMEVARMAYKYGVKPPKLVVLETEIELEERAEEHRSGTESPSSIDSGVETENFTLDVKNGRRDSVDGDSFRQAHSHHAQVVDKPISDKDNHIHDIVSGDQIGHSDNAALPKSELDERVQTLVKEYDVGKIYRLKEGKYIILGRVMFVRMLNDHLLVRIGGGWDGLEHYFMTHSPARSHSRQGALEHPSKGSPQDRSASPTPSPTAWLKLKDKVKHRDGKTASSPTLNVDNHSSELSSPIASASPVGWSRGKDKVPRKNSKYLFTEKSDEQEISEAIRRIESTVSETINRKGSRPKSGDFTVLKNKLNSSQTKALTSDHSGSQMDAEPDRSEASTVVESTVSYVNGEICDPTALDSSGLLCNGNIIHIEQSSTTVDITSEQSKIESLDGVEASPIDRPIENSQGTSTEDETSSKKSPTAKPSPGKKEVTKKDVSSKTGTKSATKVTKTSTISKVTNVVSKTGTNKPGEKSGTGSNVSKKPTSASGGSKSKNVDAGKKDIPDGKPAKPKAGETKPAGKVAISKTTTKTMTTTVTKVGSDPAKKTAKPSPSTSKATEKTQSGASASSTGSSAKAKDASKDKKVTKDAKVGKSDTSGSSAAKRPAPSSAKKDVTDGVAPKKTEIKTTKKPDSAQEKKTTTSKPAGKPNEERASSAKKTAEPKPAPKSTKKDDKLTKPAAKSTPPKPKSPAAKPSSASTATKPSEVKPKTPDAKSKLAEAKAKTPEAKSKVSEAKPKPPSAKSKTPEVKKSTAAAKPKTPDEKSRAAPKPKESAKPATKPAAAKSEGKPSSATTSKAAAKPEVKKAAKSSETASKDNKKSSKAVDKKAAVSLSKSDDKSKTKDKSEESLNVIVPTVDENSNAAESMVQVGESLKRDISHATEDILIEEKLPVSKTIVETREENIVVVAGSVVETHPDEVAVASDSCPMEFVQEPITVHSSVASDHNTHDDFSNTGSTDTRGVCDVTPSEEHVQSEKFIGSQEAILDLNKMYPGSAVILEDMADVKSDFVIEYNKTTTRTTVASYDSETGANLIVESVETVVETTPGRNIMDSSETSDIFTPEKLDQDKDLSKDVSQDSVVTESLDVDKDTDFCEKSVGDSSSLLATPEPVSSSIWTPDVSDTDDNRDILRDSDEGRIDEKRLAEISLNSPRPEDEILREGAMAPTPPLSLETELETPATLTSNLLRSNDELEVSGAPDSPTKTDSSLREVDRDIKIEEQLERLEQDHQQFESYSAFSEKQALESEVVPGSEQLAFAPSAEINEYSQWHDNDKIEAMYGHGSELQSVQEPESGLSASKQVEDNRFEKDFAIQDASSYPPFAATTMDTTSSYSSSVAAPLDDTSSYSSSVAAPLDNAISYSSSFPAPTDDTSSYSSSSAPPVDDASTCLSSATTTVDNTPSDSPSVSAPLDSAVRDNETTSKVNMEDTQKELRDQLQATQGNPTSDPRMGFETEEEHSLQHSMDASEEEGGTCFPQAHVEDESRSKDYASKSELTTSESGESSCSAHQPEILSDAGFGQFESKESAVLQGVDNKYQECSNDFGHSLGYDTTDSHPKNLPEPSSVFSEYHLKETAGEKPDHDRLGSDIDQSYPEKFSNDDESPSVTTHSYEEISMTEASPVNAKDDDSAIQSQSFEMFVDGQITNGNVVHATHETEALESSGFEDLSTQMDTQNHAVTDYASGKSFETSDKFVDWEKSENTNTLLQSDLSSYPSSTEVIAEDSISKCSAYEDAEEHRDHEDGSGSVKITTIHSEFIHVEKSPVHSAPLASPDPESDEDDQTDSEDECRLSDEEIRVNINGVTGPAASMENRDEISDIYAQEQPSASIDPHRGIDEHIHDDACTAVGRDDAFSSSFVQSSDSYERGPSEDEHSEKSHDLEGSLKESKSQDQRCWEGESKTEKVSYVSSSEQSDENFQQFVSEANGYVVVDSTADLLSDHSRDGTTSVVDSVVESREAKGESSDHETCKLEEAVNRDIDKPSTIEDKSDSPFHHIEYDDSCLQTQSQAESTELDSSIDADADALADNSSGCFGDNSTNDQEQGSFASSTQDVSVTYEQHVYEKYTEDPESSKQLGNLEFSEVESPYSGFHSTQGEVTPYPGFHEEAVIFNGDEKQEIDSGVTRTQHTVEFSETMYTQDVVSSFPVEAGTMMDCHGDVSYTMSWEEKHASQVSTSSYVYDADDLEEHC